MDAAFDAEWFESYLTTFAACGRGDSDDLASLLDYYAVPLVLTSDAAAVTLTTADDVFDYLRGQVEAMRAAGYDRSEMLESVVIPINRTSALHTAEFSRRRRDGGEIGRFRATYLVTVGEQGPRLSALALHAA